MRAWLRVCVHVFEMIHLELCIECAVVITNFSCVKWHSFCIVKYGQNKVVWLNGFIVLKMRRTKIYTLENDNSFYISLTHLSDRCNMTTKQKPVFTRRYNIIFLVVPHVSDDSTWWMVSVIIHLGSVNDPYCILMQRRWVQCNGVFGAIVLVFQ